MFLLRISQVIFVATSTSSRFVHALLILLVSFPYVAFLVYRVHTATYPPPFAIPPQCQAGSPQGEGGLHHTMVAL